MPNLSNQQINQSFNGLLQIPGGITSSLQPVLDGNGNATGLSLSTTGSNVATSTTALVSKNNVAFANAIPRRISDLFGQVLYVEDFGAVGNGTTDDTTAIQNALNAAPKNTTVYLSQRYYVTGLTIPETITLSGSGYGAGSNDNYNSSYYNSLNSVLLLSSSGTILARNACSIQNIYIFQYGLSLPQNSPASFSGTAITLNAGLAINTVDVVLKNLLIIGFNIAVNGYYCPRLICDTVAFDCNNGIQINTAGDPIKFFNCHGWPYGTIAGTNINAGIRDRRSGNGYSFSTNADAGKIVNCFAFGYTTGFNVNTVNGLTFIDCGADDYNLIAPITSYGWVFNGDCGFTSLIGCQSVAHIYGISFTVSADTNILQIIGGTVGINTSDNIHCTKGTIIANSVVFGSGATGIACFGAGNSVTVDNCSFQGITFALVLNNANSPYITIGSNNITYQTDSSSIPMYSGGSAYISIASAATVSVPASGNQFLITGTTNISSIIGGWPGRIITLRFNDILTVTDSAGLNLAGNFTTSSNDTLTLTFIDSSNCFEVARSVN